MNLTTENLTHLHYHNQSRVGKSNHNWSLVSLFSQETTTCRIPTTPWTDLARPDSPLEQPTENTQGITKFTDQSHVIENDITENRPIALRKGVRSCT